jgi:hypothetical protein
MDEIRIMNGKACWTDDFTVPSSPYSGSLDCQDASLDISDSAGNYATVGSPVTFYANYSRFDNGSIISGAECVLDIEGVGSYNMTEISGKYQYTLSSGLPSEHGYRWNVICGSSSSETHSKSSTIASFFPSAASYLSTTSYSSDIYKSIADCTKINDTVCHVDPATGTQMICMDYCNQTYNYSLVNIGDCFISVNSSADLSANTSDYLFINNSDGHCGDNRIYYTEDVLDSADAIRSRNTICPGDRCTIIDSSNAGQYGDLPSVDTSTLNRSKGVFLLRHNGFSSYAIGSNSRLDISNDNDTGTSLVGTDVTFYAIYANYTSGAPISGATCHIWFSDNSTQLLMSENATDYEYVRSFSSIGSYNFTVNCTATGYNTLDSTDDITIASPTTPAVPEFNIFTIVLGLMAVTTGLIILKRQKK